MPCFYDIVPVASRLHVPCTMSSAELETDPNRLIKLTVQVQLAPTYILRHVCICSLEFSL